jgi:hypothetical protein
MGHPGQFDAHLRGLPQDWSYTGRGTLMSTLEALCTHSRRRLHSGAWAACARLAITLSDWRDPAVPVLLEHAVALSFETP